MAIGRSLAQEDGLLGAYLPRDLPLAVAVSIVLGANDSRRLDPPFAILVSDSNVGAGQLHGIDIVSVRNAVGWRHGDRLAVLCGTPGLIQSLTGTYRSVIGASYPTGASGAASLENVAEKALDLVLQDFAPAGLTADLRTHATMCLFEAMELSSKIHESLGSGAVSWNCKWFHHVGSALENLKRAMQHVPQDTVIAEALESLIFPAFGLPRPLKGEYRLYSKSGLFATSVVENWSSEAKIANSVAALGDHALAHIDWAGFDSAVAGLDDPFTALCVHDGIGSARTLNFRELTEEQFLDPFRREMVVPLRLCDDTGQSLSICGHSESPCVLPIKSHDPVRGAFVSIPIRIAIPLLERPTHDRVQSTGMSIVASRSEIHVDYALDIEDEWLVASGVVVLQNSDTPENFSPAQFSLTVKVPSNDSLANFVSDGPRILIYPTSLQSAGCLVFPNRKDGRLSAGSYHEAIATAEFEYGDSNGLCVIEVTNPNSHTILTWGVEVDSTPTVDGRTIREIADGVLIWVFNYEPPEAVVLEIAGSRFEIVAEEATTTSSTPLLAALHDVALSRERLPEPITESARGALEDQLVKAVIGDEWRINLGHHAISEESGGDGFDDSEYDGVRVATEMVTFWKQNDPLLVPAEILESAEVGAFRDAFAALEVHKAIRIEDSDGSVTHSWISQTSWRYLSDPDDGRMESYLNAYAALVERAREVGDPAGVFWAAYPFSFSVWQLEQSPRVLSILLSPLHPVRLAWLSRFEHALSEIDSGLGSAIAGTVEGWNIPLLGPREISGSQMMALPTESGVDHIFAGWNMLVRLSNEFEQPAPPVRVAGRMAPATSTSGLNAAAVESSIRDFRRIHPHLSTIAIDIATATSGVRSSDVDGAVINASRGLLTDGLSPLPGGVRVFDSSRRIGEIPEKALLSLGASSGEAPLTWKRYDPDADSPPRSNLRFLEDSGVNIKVSEEQGDSRAGGVLAHSGLRRFEICDTVTQANSFSTHPVIRHDTGWPPLARALRVLEGGQRNPVIETRIQGSALQSGASDWTVSGEGNLSPVVLADLLAKADPDETQVLWEWRPPFLEARSNGDLLERRPYISVVRLPAGFRESVANRLATARNRALVGDEVTSVLGALGARGIGLSSLLANGGSHATGALGFYLALKLVEKSAPHGCERLVLPIDACDRFLRALADDDGSQQLQRRADLLIVDLYSEQVQLTAVEIKYYGLAKSGGQVVLPEAEAPALHEALTQLVSSCKRLELLKAFQDDLEFLTPGTQELWWNAFACLIDAGIRLSPKRQLSVDELSQRFRRILDGEAVISVNRPVAMYFQQNGRQAKTGNRFIAASVREIQDGLPRGYRALIADPSLVFDELERSGELIEAWQRLMAEEPQDEEAEPNVGDDELVPEADGQLDPSHPKAENGTPASVLPMSGRLDNWVASFPVSDGIRFPVGCFIDSVGQVEADYWPGNTDLNQLNCGVVGDLGTGKTQLVKSLIYNLRCSTNALQEHPLSLLVFDYKRDFQDRSFVDAVGGKVLPPSCIPLNIFALTQGYSKTAGYQRARAFVDVISKIYGGVGPVQSNRLIEAIQDLYERTHGVPPTLREVRDEYLTRSGSADSVVSVLNIFVEGEIFDDQIDRLIPFDKLIEDKVLVISLSEVGSDQATKNAIVVLFLNAYYEYMLSRPKWPFAGSQPQLRKLNSFLVVDEATNILQYDFSVLKSILLQGREFGVGVVLSSQFLDHFKVGQENYGQALGSWMIHKVPSVTYRQLQSLGIPEATEVDAKRIAGLANHETYYKSLNSPGRFVRGTPFFELDKDRSG